LSRTPREGGGGQHFSDEWTAVHEAFHEALFSGSGNRRLLAIVRSFGEEAALYRRWSIPLEPNRDVAEEHQGIMEAALNRDADLAAERLCEHISYTAQLLLGHSREVVARSRA
jgi:DNA-binding GntR family transcriptional regulator